MPQPSKTKIQRAERRPTPQPCIRTLRSTATPTPTPTHRTTDEKSASTPRAVRHPRMCKYRRGDPRIHTCQRGGVEPVQRRGARGDLNWEMAGRGRGSARRQEKMSSRKNENTSTHERPPKLRVSKRGTSVGVQTILPLHHVRMRPRAGRSPASCQGVRAARRRCHRVEEIVLS
ncbi:hypothetical protein B0H10DRAFT_705398 [Mycena sp. CBHHK59/15]|nr:hypothetical protein B0H10DRAFT_705398 [Mycena sp. CBHHK59/15]